MEAITASYAEHADDWSVTVTGRGEELTEHAPGIIAARDRAEHLIESLKPETGDTAVVHLLRGSALEFTTAYMTARLGRDTGEEASETNENETNESLVPHQARGEPDQRDTSEDDTESEAGHGGPAEPTAANTSAPSDDDDAHETDGAGATTADSAQELAQQ